MTVDDEWNAMVRRRGDEQAAAKAAAEAPAVWPADVDINEVRALGQRIDSYVKRFVAEVHRLHGQRMQQLMLESRAQTAAYIDKAQRAARWSWLSGREIPVPTGAPINPYSLLPFPGSPTIQLIVRPTYIMWQRKVGPPNFASPLFSVTSYGQWALLRYYSTDTGSDYTSTSGYVPALGFNAQHEFVMEPDLFRQKLPADYAPLVLHLLTECAEEPL